MHDPAATVLLRKPRAATPSKTLDVEATLVDLRPYGVEAQGPPRSRRRERCATLVPWLLFGLSSVLLLWVLLGERSSAAPTRPALEPAPSTPVVRPLPMDDAGIESEPSATRSVGGHLREGVDALFDGRLDEARRVYAHRSPEELDPVLREVLLRWIDAELER